MASNHTSRRQQLSGNIKSAIATAAILGTLGGWVAFGSQQAATADTSTVATSVTAVAQVAASDSTLAQSSSASSSTASTSSSTASQPTTQPRAVTTTRSSR